ncbi:MAG TPA: hypothetical protein VGR19_09205 [Allosphingosinicella sp.]|nr:hypothetical protein [Allosphingosinicella sp.]
MASEKRILNEALIAVSALPDVMAWRNNTGMAWQSNERMKVGVGSMVRVTPGMVILLEARPVSFGLPGSGDIMGLQRGRAFAIETKTSSGRQSEQQRKFEAAFRRAGGLYGLARDVDQALAVLASE